MKNVLILLVVLLCASCTTEVYRGEVVLEVSPTEKVIELYGSNQSILTTDPNLKVKDIVEVTTKNNLKKFAVKFLCTPAGDDGHCNYGMGFEHDLLHIIKDNSVNTTIDYKGKTFQAAKVYETNPQDYLKVWVSNSLTLGPPIQFYPTYLRDANNDIRKPKGRALIKSYTTNSHPH